MTTPNLGMLLPSVQVTPGPTYAQEQNDAMLVIDGHDHSSGKGLQITPLGLNINQDLPINGNNLGSVRGLRLQVQSTVPAGATDIAMVYSYNGDLFYRNQSGAYVQLTSGGSIAGASGTISGLVSPASAYFSSGTDTFTFNQGASLPGKLNISDINLFENGNATANPVTIKSPAALAAPYSMYLPPANPTVAGSILQSDTSGNTSWQSAGLLPIGSVIATFPNLSGAYSTTNTTAADQNGFVLCQGQSISDATSPMNGATIPNISAGAFIYGGASSGSSGGATSSSGVGAHSHTITYSAGSSVAAASHTHVMTHIHQWCYQSSSLEEIYSQTTSSGTNSTYGTVGIAQLTGPVNLTAGSGVSASTNAGNEHAFYTSGAMSATSGTDITSPKTATESADTTIGMTSTGTSFSIMPPYITAVYLMRIK